MPGSSIIQTGLSTVYNSRYLATNHWNNTNTFSGLTVSGNTLNVQSPASNFPFTTGDRVYFQNINSDSPNVNVYQSSLFYAVVLSPTQMQLATSLSNALANPPVIATLTDVTSAINNASLLRAVVSNVTVPVTNSGNPLTSAFTNNSNFLASKWNSSALSSQSFFINDRVMFEFDLPECSMAGVMSLEKRDSGIPVYGFSVSRASNIFLPGVGDTFSFVSGNVICGRDITGESSGNNFAFNAGSGRVRITVQNNTISVGLSTGATVYTTSPLAVTSPLNFFAFNSLNNTGLTNCTITYL